jgi:MoaA/NifB/PqqE/SkfB family radical SAM enzyme
MSSQQARYKNPCIVVLPEANGRIRLLGPSPADELHLDPEAAEAWLEWEEERLHVLIPALLACGFVTEGPAAAAPLPTEWDSLRPAIDRASIRWYAETADLTVMLCTAQMTRPNPLLVLGPYGSTVWRGLLESRSILELRAHALRVFGQDEVVPFIRRLMDLGFLEANELKNLAPGRIREVVVKEFAAPSVQFMLDRSSVPWYCLWELNTICDLRCKICYLPDYEHQGLTDDALDRVMAEIVRSGTLFVSLMGGEVLLRGDLERIVGYLRGAGIYVKAITNGQKLSIDRATSLMEAGLNQIEVSFDGLTAETHDRSRGSRGFSHAENALRNAGQVGNLRTSVVVTIHSRNLSELPGLPDFLHSHDVRECYLSVFRKTGLGGSQAEFDSPTASQLAEVRTMIRQWLDRHPDLTITLLPMCTCGRTSVVVGHDGGIRPCPFSYNTAVGSLLNEDLGLLWGRAMESLSGGQCLAVGS